jgi:hypothetical protein
LKQLVVLTVAVLFAVTASAQSPAPEPLHYTKLIPCLPDKVEGFVAEKPEGSTAAAMGFKLTEVSRTYHQGREDAAETVTVKITDGAGNQFFAAAHATAPPFSRDTDEGYEKGFNLEGYPAVERYTNESKDGSLTVFIAPRYLVEVNASGLDSKALQEWWKKIDVKKLMELQAS